MLNRRHFLTAAGLVLMERMGSLQPISARGTTPVTDPKQIVVVGAGLAGLAAAGELHRHGHRVAILEARHRIGGRIWTSTRWQEMPLDLGATWIHGVDGNPLTELADRAHIDRVVTQYERSVAYHTSGRPLTDAEQTHIDTLRTQVVSRLRSAQSRETDLTVHQAVASLRSQFAEASDEARFIDFILNSDLEQEYSGSTAHLSAQWYDHAQEFEGDDALFVQGFSALPNFLAEGLQVQQGEVVKAIDWSSSPVRLVTQRAEYTADYVVLTLPLGVLQAHSIEFRPALPPAKQHAINTLGMGVLNKCYLRFAHVFWPADADWLEYVSAEPGQWTEWVSFSRAARWPVLLGFHAAEPGRRIEALSDQNIVASAMQTLRTIFGRDTTDPIDYQITRWASDPFARGSYSFNAIGTTQETRSDLAAPLDDVVFFAGEATESDHFGTAHGAYISGLRAAQEIIALES